LQKAKEEIEKLKEEAHANKVHMLQVIIIFLSNYCYFIIKLTPVFELYTEV